MSSSAKTASAAIMVLAIVVSVITLIVLGMFSVWKEGSVPVAYVIIDVIDNRRIELPECGEPQITILQNVETEQISYRCDVHGQISEIVTLYE